MKLLFAVEYIIQFQLSLKLWILCLLTNSNAFNLHIPGTANMLKLLLCTSHFHRASILFQELTHILPGAQFLISSASYLFFFTF